MSFDIWKPLYVDDFDCEKYLYHYTNFDTAIKIIHSNTLLFSSVSKTNDTSESKIKIGFEYSKTCNQDLYKDMIYKITDYLKKYTQIVQLLCLSMDTKISESERKKYLAVMSHKDVYYDVSGRGFALPRMWAQYANNNEGVCFVFNKAKLLEQVKSKIAFSKSATVKYKKFYNKYIITVDRMKSLYDKISLLENGSLTLLDMIQKDKDFLNYNLFEKLDDWKNEHEYRIIALIDKKDSRMPVSQMASYLEGIVVGEKMDKAYEQTIKLLSSSINPKCEVKRIQFDSRMCKVI
ncbi:MAG: DUF2971 domain-containing protein [Lachnospiraceae bacterium]|nr:DUF2971 domain-containing protein [Lachnospiraceae bacterium]